MDRKVNKVEPLLSEHTLFGPEISVFMIFTLITIPYSADTLFYAETWKGPEGIHFNRGFTVVKIGKTEFKSSNLLLILS